jgi:hypothetical protein
MLLHIQIYHIHILVLRAAVLRTAGFKNRPLLFSSIAIIIQHCLQCCSNAEGRNLFPAASAAARTDVRSPLLLSSIAIIIQHCLQCCSNAAGLLSKPAVLRTAARTDVGYKYAAGFDKAAFLFRKNLVTS